VTIRGKHFFVNSLRACVEITSDVLDAVALHPVRSGTADEQNVRKYIFARLLR
jgi:hypothetical protein